MPGAADGFADENTLVERSAVVRALAAHGEPVWLDMNEQHRLAKCVTGDELTRVNTADLETLRQVRADQLIGMLGHFCSLSSLWARSRWATKAGATLVSRSFTCAF